MFHQASVARSDPESGVDFLLEYIHGRHADRFVKRPLKIVIGVSGANSRAVVTQSASDPKQVVIRGGS